MFILEARLVLFIKAIYYAGFLLFKHPSSFIIVLHDSLNIKSAQALFIKIT